MDIMDRSDKEDVDLFWKVIVFENGHFDAMGIVHHDAWEFFELGIAHFVLVVAKDKVDPVFHDLFDGVAPWMIERAHFHIGDGRGDGRLGKPFDRVGLVAKDEIRLRRAEIEAEP